MGRSRWIGSGCQSLVLGVQPQIRAAYFNGHRFLRYGCSQLRENGEKEMEAPKIAQFARNFAVMVRVQGPDPKGMKMRRNAFHLHESGKTSISASGLLLLASSLSQIPRVIKEVCSIHKFSGAMVVTVASVVEPFLTADHRNKLNQDMLQELSPRLIHDVLIDVLVEAGSGHQGPEATSEWLPAKLLALIHVPAASEALLSLIGAQSSWEASWSLAPLNGHKYLELVGFERKVGNNVESRRDAALEESDSSILLARSVTRIACLGISTPYIKEDLHLNISQNQNRGDLIAVMGSPFGVLSPMHFFNSISVGNMGNCFPSGSRHSSLLLADMRCLPGMEGGPVFDRHSHLVGILTKPLRQKGSNAEIQLVVTWNAIASLCIESQQQKDQNTQVGLIDRIRYSDQVASTDRSCHSGSQTCLIGRPALSGPSLTSLEKAMSSVVLVAVGEGSWASGIVLNNNGLILTNAHILDPIKFGRTSQMGLTAEGASSLTKLQTLFDQQENKFVEKVEGKHLGSSVSSHMEMFSAYGYQSSRRISVRLDFMQKQIWYSAQAVYVSQGPLDVALLQLEYVQPQLSPITSQMACPSEGSVVHVIGHCLLGPRSKALPSISSGILSNVVQIPGPFVISGSRATEPREMRMPVMLQTTAAVHPGASGGAVINSTGHMIGLVTSNARHGGGTIIPHLNFSIPCAALEPIFKFSETQDASILQDLDKPNEVLSSVWALAPPPSKKSQPEFQSKNYREGKGSRFSQFLAEKKIDLNLKEIDHLKKGKLPSKV